MTVTIRLFPGVSALLPCVVFSIVTFAVMSLVSRIYKWRGTAVMSHYAKSVSYTHLDVYKRQPVVFFFHRDVIMGLNKLTDVETRGNRTLRRWACRRPLGHTPVKSREVGVDQGSVSYTHLSYLPSRTSVQRISAVSPTEIRF